MLLKAEATCLENKPIDPQEVIKISVQVYDLNAKSAVKEEKKIFVRPTKNPKLDEFCIKHTQVTQEDVDKGITFE